MQRLIKDHYEQLYGNKIDNLEEMDRFLEKFDLPRLNQEEIEIMNNPVISTEIEAVIKNLPKHISPWPNGFKGVFYQTFREEIMPIFLKLFQKLKREVKDGKGIGRGDHFLPHKFIKRSIESWTNTTKQLLNAGGGHQAPRKATYCLQKEVGQIIKDKKGDKRVRDRYPSCRRSLKREVSKHQEILSLTRLCGVLESQKAA